MNESSLTHSYRQFLKKNLGAAGFGSPGRGREPRIDRIRLDPDHRYSTTKLQPPCIRFNQYGPRIQPEIMQFPQNPVDSPRERVDRETKRFVEVETHAAPTSSARP